jgi:glycosyltransferase involved in cell wall biosynthesis
VAALTATVMIATKNRRSDLRRAILSCLKQTAAPEVIVLDDGSTDDTSDMVRREFATVRYYRDDVSRGATAQRNRGVQLASGSIVFSIDDDAEFTSPHTVAQTLAEFASPMIGVVAIPLVNVNTSDAVLQRAPSPDGVFLLDTFWGGACAMRRDVFLRVGGYREYLRLQYEEEDLAIRILDAGYLTRLGNADPIYHYESPVRDNRRRDILGGRNKVLISWYNVPMPELLFHLPGTCAKTILHGMRQGHGSRWALGVAKGLLTSLAQFGRRHPVRHETYRLFRRLRGSPATPLEEARREFGLVGAG